MHLILVRHGETDWNVSLQYQGHAAVPLNARGREQAHRTAQRLATYGAVALYTSDLLRAAQTAEIMSGPLKLAPRVMSDLREIDVGQWEGLPPEELYRRFPEQMQAYQRDPARTVRAGGESYAQLQTRAVRALKQIQANHQLGELVVAVSHGGTIRALLCDIIGLDLAHFGRLWLDNGSLTELRYDRHGWRLVRLNDAAHLEGLFEVGGALH